MTKNLRVWCRLASSRNKALACRKIAESQPLKNKLSVQAGTGVQSAPIMSNTHALTTTTFELPGYRITKSFGVVRGIIVRSRSVVGNIGASIQSIFGGNISIYTTLCEQ